MAIAETCAGAAAEPSSGAAEGRIWLWNGSTDVYFGFRFLDGKDAIVQAFDPDSPERWKDVIGYVRHQLPAEGTKTIMVVGPAPQAFVAQALELQAAGHAVVVVAPDVGVLARAELARFPGTISVALASPEGLVEAQHAASLLRRADRIVVPTADPVFARELSEIGRVDAVHALGPGAAGVDLPGRQEHASVQTFLAHELGRDASCPHDGPLILAVYTGKEVPEDQNPNINRPLAFYNSTTVASLLGNSRPDMVYLQLTVQPGEFTLNPPLGMPIGWQVEIEPSFDAQIKDYVTSWNTANADCPITRLAIVAHPLDIPYRRYLLPSKAFCSGWTPEVDYGTTDNTDPRNGSPCNLDGPPPAGANPDRPFDGSTPSADFFYADVESEQDINLPVSAELAYGRVAGQTLADATALVNTDRFKLGIISNPNRELGNGARVNSTEAELYETTETLFGDFYQRSSGPDVDQPCKPPRIPQSEPGWVPPFCATASATETSGYVEYRCIGMDYRWQESWVYPLREGQTEPPYEFVILHGHQDGTKETPEGESASQGNATPPIKWTDRQRVQFVKPQSPAGSDCAGAYYTPDHQAPMYTTEEMRANGPYDLAASVWMMGASSAGIYNYINKSVRDPLLGPDSSWLSTLPTSGVAAWFISLSVDPDYTYPNATYTGTAYRERLLRELSFGRTLGEALRSSGNAHASGTRAIRSRPATSSGWG